MAAENILLLNASAIRCFPSPPTKILTFKEMMEKLVIFSLGIEAQSISGSWAIAALSDPNLTSLLSLVPDTVNPSALPALQSRKLRSVMCDLQMTHTFPG